MVNQMVRIGIISDTHIRGDAAGIPPQIFEAFAEVDLILHCGDVYSLSVLDRLEAICPVLAVRGYADPKTNEPRLDGPTRIVTIGGIRIGMIHHINWPGPRLEKMNGALEFPPEPMVEVMKRKFGSPVDVVVFGDSHEELVVSHEGVLFVNPGSPLYPGVRHRTGDLGTVAILSISEGAVNAEIMQL